MDARPRAPPCTGGQRRDPCDDAALAPRQPARLHPRAGHRRHGRGARVRRRAPHAPAARPVRCGGRTPPLAARLRVRRRARRVVSVFLPPRRQRAAEAPRLSARRELDRGVDEELLAALRRPRDRHDRVARPACVRTDPPRRVLHLTDARQPTRGRGLPRDAGRAAGALCGHGAAEAADGGGPDARRLRGTARARETYRPSRAGVRRRPASSCRSCGSSYTATDPSTARIAHVIDGARVGDAVRAGRQAARGRRSTPRWHAPPVLRPLPSARATVSSSSRRPRTALRVSSWRGPRTRPSSSSRTASTGSSRPTPRRRASQPHW